MIKYCIILIYGQIVHLPHGNLSSTVSTKVTEELGSCLVYFSSDTLVFDVLNDLIV